MRMGRAIESARLLDELDLTMTLDSRSTSSQQMTNIEVACRPIVIRASYGDILLITAIVNKAVDVYGKSQQGREETSNSAAEHGSRLSSKVVSSGHTQLISPTSIGTARVLVLREQVRVKILSLALTERLSS